MFESILSAIIIAFIIIALSFWFMGWRWESRLVRPKAKGFRPLVSIIIPAYKSEKTIEDTIKSAKKVSYKPKEIIVVNDSKDRTPEICKKLGVKLIQNKRRVGKAAALNNAVKKSRGEILFFLDADTTIESDALKKIVPWFTIKDIGAVSPKYIAKKSKSIISRLASIENNFNSSLFKAHMFFGSMITIRGCGVAIRRSVFNDVGGWSKTLIEDVDMAAKILKAGYKIQYEPYAIVKTKEPETIAELKNQRTRWGKGTAYSLINHHSMYSKNKQLLIHFVPYIFLTFAIIGTFLWQIYIFIPIILIYLLFSYSLTTLEILMIFIIQIIYWIFMAVITGAISHLTIITWKERESRSESILLIPYVLFYSPLVLFLYIKGMISGFSYRRYSKKELDLRDWKC
ncbi:MAG: glycosyltransferase family 2 protein [Candidatus Aenigmatarchaeota archaeon]